ncbi:hypothetical protein BT96DRAFT_38394 [Gymnopus androsaceus JB14]|uniref:Uncharacterized protein n=1 Tax=Gymnopus androsaceus JB14 TaxID=1447944 RepID=A0A6A4HMJ0_9AGAR|nr:hypothetical protein BT96DRAFT_38394 [Gymnopus androsaceus JB14]
MTYQKSIKCPYLSKDFCIRTKRGVGCFGLEIVMEIGRNCFQHLFLFPSSLHTGAPFREWQVGLCVAGEIPPLHTASLFVSIGLQTCFINTIVALRSCGPYVRIWNLHSRAVVQSQAARYRLLPRIGTCISFRVLALAFLGYSQPRMLSYSPVDLAHICLASYHGRTQTFPVRRCTPFFRSGVDQVYGRVQGSRDFGLIASFSALRGTRFTWDSL